MPDINGKPDTREMYDHWNVEKTTAAGLMQAAADLGNFSGELTVDAKAVRVARFRGAHPDCVICRTFEGNLPA